MTSSANSSVQLSTKPSEIVRIEFAERSYNIHIGASLLDNADVFDGLPKASVAVIVSNTTIAPIYAARLQASLLGRYKTIHTIVLPDGEAHKTWQTLNLIFDDLLKHSCDRKTTLFALGGGVVGDMTGFAAASYMRGVPFVQVPTTLAGAGRFIRWWQNRHQPPVGQKHGWRVLPAATGVVRFEHA